MSLLAWAWRLGMPVVLARLLFLAWSGRYQVINRTAHPGFFWGAIVVWGLSLAAFVVGDLILLAALAVRLSHPAAG